RPLRVAAVASAAPALSMSAGCSLRMARARTTTGIAVLAVVAPRTVGRGLLATVTAGLERLPLGSGGRRGARHHFPGSPAFDQAFDIRQQFVFVDAHQGGCLTFRASTASTANPVHVIFRHVR